MKYICPFMLISIPSGAIKSEFAFPLNAPINVFQFLLVRLKVIVEFTPELLNKIFQFLLVRLKEHRFRKIG